MARVGCRIAVALLLGVALALPTSSQAAFPGTNGKIAYVRDDFVIDSQIRVVNANGSGVEKLTSTGENFNPRWSANGRRIVFASSRDGNFEIYTMDADGGNQTRVTNDPAVDYNPTWSPDGQRIAFQRRTTGFYDIYSVAVGGGGLANLTNGQGGSEPAWSPDGTKIAYISGNNVFSMNADGTGRTQLTSYPTPSRESFREPGNPDWSPDGSQITYDLLFGGSSHFYNSIHVMNADGSGDVEHFFGSAVVWGPAFSPDGAEIVFSCDAGLCFLPPPDVFLPVLLPGLDRFDSEPDWQPIVPAPQRGHYKNGAKFCKAEQTFWGDQFASRYGGGANAYGKCVSQSH
jgi:Tol biopolymer transport system component